MDLVERTWKEIKNAKRGKGVFGLDEKDVYAFAIYLLENYKGEALILRTRTLSASRDFRYQAAYIGQSGLFNKVVIFSDWRKVRDHKTPLDAIRDLETVFEEARANPLFTKVIPERRVMKHYVYYGE